MVSKKKKKYLMYTVEVEWLDHSGWTNNNWRHIDEDRSLTPFKVTSYGVVVKETDDYIVLLPHLSENGAGQGTMCIIKSCIKKIRKVKA